MLDTKSNLESSALIGKDEESMVESFDIESGQVSNKWEMIGFRSPSNEGDEVKSAPAFRDLVILTFGTCFFFMACSFIEELTFQKVPGFKYSGLLTTYELFGFAAFAFGQSLYDVRQHLPSMVSSPSIFIEVYKPRAPMTVHMLIAGAMAFARALTNLSLMFLNYPTQVLFKSLKLPVVVIASVFVLKKSYPSFEYTSAILLAMSAAFFSLGDVAVTPSFDLTGIFIVCASLVGDAVHSLSQDTVLRKHNAKEEEILLYSNLFGFVISLTGNLVTNELFDAIRFFNQNPWLWFILGLRTVVVYYGVVCYVKIIKSFGIVTATTVTTIRKVLTIMCSFYFFPKPLSWKYFFALIIFALGVMVKIRGMNTLRTQSKLSGKVSERESNTE